MSVPRPPRRWPTLVTLASILIATSPAPAHPEESNSTLGCGPNSLYMLLELLGKHADLKDISQVLPEAHPKGYSLLDLQRAARRRGLNLWGGHLTRENTPLDRPVIAFFDGSQARTGHYAVLVPVGQTGTMVQLIDPPYYPRIVDYADIIPADSSTKILYPMNFWQTRWFLCVATTIIVVAASFLVRSRIRSNTHRRRIANDHGTA